MYDTEGGWLHLSTEELVAGAVRAQAQQWPGVKLKVGKPDLAEDAERLQAVRAAVGPRMHIMVDANQSMSYAQAMRWAHMLEDYSVFWFEEPLPAARRRRNFSIGNI